MKNPLTRGKGFLGVKVLRYALNVQNLWNVLVLARPRFPRSPETLFPQKGLVHLLNKRFSRSGPPNTFRHSQLELSCGLVKTNHVFLPLSDILSVLIPCLCLGCGLYWDSLPWLFELPLPGLITEAHSNSSGFFSGVESGRLWGIDANRLWASLNVATGSTHFWPADTSLVDNTPFISEVPRVSESTPPPVLLRISVLIPWPFWLECSFWLLLKLMLLQPQFFQLVG